MKTTQYPERSIAEQIDELNASHKTGYDYMTKTITYCWIVIGALVVVIGCLLFALSKK